MAKREVKLTQPIVTRDGRPCFKANEIVRALLDESQKRGFGLNELAYRRFSQADWEQFYQLIGYAIVGYHELSNVSDESALLASAGGAGCRENGCPIHCGVATEEVE